MSNCLAISPDGLAFGKNVTAYGGNGDDHFNACISGYSNDTMTGGNGADTFAFAFRVTSAPTPAQPLISDFRGDLGDHVDLSRIDALAGAPDDAFVWRGSQAFDGAGQVRVTQQGGVTYLETNLTGADTSEARIAFTGSLTLLESCFTL